VELILLSKCNTINHFKPPTDRFNDIFVNNKFIRLYYIENGLQVATKKFDKIEQIYLLEFIENDEKLLIIGESLEKKEKELSFIIWDLYNTGTVERIKIDCFRSKKILVPV
jgi:hypothetical protein